MFEGLLLPWPTNLPFCFLIQFLERTPKVSTSYFVEISQVLSSETFNWLFSHKRADFVASKFWIFFHFSASLRCFDII